MKNNELVDAMGIERRDFLKLAGLGGLTALTTSPFTAPTVLAQTTGSDPMTGLNPDQFPVPPEPVASASFPVETVSAEFVVCGGGMAGLCAAIAAARAGVKTVLLQDRPVLGGNSSSEIRVTPHGSARFHAFARETGIIGELSVAERAKNHAEIIEVGWTNSVWDLILYDAAMAEPNLTVYMSSPVVDVQLADGRRSADRLNHDRAKPNTAKGYMERPACNSDRRIARVRACVLNGEKYLDVEGQQFLDATGDGTVAHLAGAEWRMGSEPRSEFDEPNAPERGTLDVQGNTLAYKAIDIGRPAPFQRPDWAIEYTLETFRARNRAVPTEFRSGFWWIELGVPWHVIHDHDVLRHELTRHVLGIWDFIKNTNPATRERARNWALDWVGQVPGKRESRRIAGLHWARERELYRGGDYPDEVGYGGWIIDLHRSGGLLANKVRDQAPESYDTGYHQSRFVRMYGFPLRSLIARDFDNLFIGGRCVGASRVVFGSMRVQMTTGILGQAIGVAAAHAIRAGVPTTELPIPGRIERIQQTLLREGAFLLHTPNEDEADLARQARVQASSEYRFSEMPEQPMTGFDQLVPGEGIPPTGPMPLNHTRAQWIYCSREVERIQVWISNRASSAQSFRWALRPAEHIWDKRRITGDAEAEGEVTVPAGHQGWVDLSMRGPVSGTPGYRRLQLHGAQDLAVLALPGTLPGMPSGVAHTEFRAVGDIGFSTRAIGLRVRVAPAQQGFGPEQVINGVARPYRAPNLWMSDPASRLPAWIELRWPHPVALADIRLTFPGQLAYEYHWYPPFWRDPLNPKNYTLEAAVGASLRPVVHVSGNNASYRRHVLDRPVRSDRLRLTITETHGEPFAAVTEIRCYAEPQTL